ncbi:MAG: hypothetical protein LRZ88_03500 [Candidatus Cloacimonetes bacterium]|nr:hypothetical protein [Candidatus Cloacimonadota bacterium]
MAPITSNAFPKAENYNLFDLYLFTSQRDLANAQSLGIKCGQVGGYPKLDPYLNAKLIGTGHSDKNKVLFTATYDSSGMSAVHLWLKRLPDLTAKYEIYVSLHPWMSKAVKESIAGMSEVHYVKRYALTKYQQRRCMRGG